MGPLISREHRDKVASYVTNAAQEGAKGVLDGTDKTLNIEAGSAFDVAGNSGFTITVKDGICEYICSFIQD